ncbi:hypothetical protein TKK_0002323 [Trichogramma kaykai]
MSSSVTSCSKCQINFSCVRALACHQLLFHCIPCMQCLNVFESDYELESHVCPDPSLKETSHQDVGEQVLTTEPNPREGSQNEIDDFDWTKFNEVPRIEVCYDLEQNKHHRSVPKLAHKGQKDLECHVCLKLFSCSSSLKAHQESIHERRRDYVCDVCQKRFSRKSIVMKHKKIVHDKRKDYKCDECHKVFSEQGNLKQHKKAIHEVQNNFECDTCQLDKTHKNSS